MRLQRGMAVPGKSISTSKSVQCSSKRQTRNDERKAPIQEPKFLQCVMLRPEFEVLYTINTQGV